MGGGASQLLEPCHLVVFPHLCWTTTKIKCCHYNVQNKTDEN